MTGTQPADGFVMCLINPKQEWWKVSVQRRGKSPASRPAWLTLTLASGVPKQRPLLAAGAFVSAQAHQLSPTAPAVSALRLMTRLLRLKARAEEVKGVFYLFGHFTSPEPIRRMPKIYKKISCQDLVPFIPAPLLRELSPAPPNLRSNTDPARKETSQKSASATLQRLATWVV